MPTLTKNENSYLTVAEADTLIDNTFYSSVWATKSGDDKARSLITATRFIDALPLKGGRVSSTQDLAFPRVIDDVTQESVPSDVLLAVALEAVSVKGKGGISPTDLKSIQINKVNIDFSDLKSESLEYGFSNSEALDLLSVFIEFTTTLSRV